MTPVSGVIAESLPVVLPPEKELFATLLAAGLSTREAAKRCGLAKDYGWDLSQKPEIRARVIQLAEEPSEAVKRSIRAELQVLRHRAMLYGGDETVRAEIQIRLQVLMAQAKVEGLIIDKKQVDKRSLNATYRGSREEIMAALQADLERLAPGASTALERLGRPAAADDLKAIAAGELVESNNDGPAKPHSQPQQEVTRKSRT